jgi:hypothetical protein
MAAEGVPGEIVAMEVTYIECPDALDLLPFMGLHVVALSDGQPGISGKAHIRKYSGEIAEFPLGETVFKCVRDK